MEVMQIKATKVFLDTVDCIDKGYNIIIQEGSSRSSKTWSNFLYIHRHAYEISRRKIIVLRDTKTSCYENVEPDYLDFLHYTGLIVDVKHNKSLHKFTFDNGSEIKFSGADAVDSIIGKGTHIVWVNEPYGFDFETLNQLMQRTSLTLLDWNPKQNHFIEDLKKRNNAKVLHSTFRDNPFCSARQKQHILSYRPLKAEFIVKDRKFHFERYKEENHLPPKWNEKFSALLQIKEEDIAKDIIKNYELSDYQKQEVFRAWSNEKYGTASKWHWEVYGLGMKSEATNRIFKGWESISEEDYNEVEGSNGLELYGLDFGVVDPTTLVSVKYKDGALYVKLHVYTPESKMLYGDGTQYNLGEFLLLNSTLELGTETYVICDSADNDRYTNKSKVAKLRELGINAFKVSKPEIVERINVLKKLKVYYVNDNKSTYQETDNKGNTSVLDLGKSLENEYENYQWEQVIRNGKVKNRPNLLKPDHALDALGYVVWNMYNEGLISFLDESTP